MSLPLYTTITGSHGNNSEDNARTVNVNYFHSGGRKSKSEHFYSNKRVVALQRYRIVRYPRRPRGHI